MKNPHQATKDLEAAVAEYTGAPFVVAVNSCTMALLLAVKWHIGKLPKISIGKFCDDGSDVKIPDNRIEIPNRTYVSVPQSIIHAGGRPTFRDENWVGMYQLKPLPVWDSARNFTSGMYEFGIPTGRAEDWRILPKGNLQSGLMQCVSFHASKILGDSQGGAILHDNPEADAWFRRARFDGRTEGVAPKDDTFNQIGYHCYMSPDVATRLLWKLSTLPRHNDPLKNDQYPDLSLCEIFK